MKFSCSDFIVGGRFSFEGRSSFEICQKAHEIRTQRGICMVFYVDETFRQKIYGEFNGVTFYLRANNGDEAGKKTC